MDTEKYEYIQTQTMANYYFLKFNSYFLRVHFGPGPILGAELQQ